MQDGIKKKVNSIKKQQIEYAKPIVIIVFMVATAVVPIYFEAVNAEKDQNSSDYLLSNLYELKIDFNKVFITKPIASRQVSSELYLVCFNYKSN